MMLFRKILKHGDDDEKYDHLREGFKKNVKKYGLLPNPPQTPPPRFGHFSGKKIDPHFFLEIRPLLGETNFTLGPISKSILFCF